MPVVSSDQKHAVQTDTGWVVALGIAATVAVVAISLVLLLSGASA